MELPEDIIVDILRRLPVKSVGRFRCVSKTWRSLISDPNFVRTHLSRHIQPHLSLGTACRIILSRYADTLLSLRPHEDDDGFAEAVELDFHLVRHLPYYVKGHCDGILCLVINDGAKGLLVVYNPSIREYRRLPPPRNFRSTREVFGIGYDSSIGDYKIVRVPSMYCRVKCPGYIPRVEILTLKSNSWRTLPDHDTPPYFVEHIFQATNVNGGLYWLCEDRDASKCVILRFDLVEEKFKVVPPGPDDFNWSITWLGSLRDSLCVIHSQRMSHVHIWSTKDDETWTKLITIPTFPGPNFSVSSFRYTPLCYTKTGALLMRVRGEGFVVYEPGENRFRQLQVRGADHHLQEIVYYESLVSPYGGNVNESASDREEHRTWLGDTAARSIRQLVNGLKRGFSFNGGRSGRS
ncbi:hypothetical protein FNV43_RR24367 [Rhamnella rubrinervis]|uniref:F-box domain-containing protein n=1 Tax=Rhamnella rubrinervis TaxID=2594499 RepID=A0A8K0DLL7_9ROSA|nr:hypothetical protein FNV43_RR24367 [Rhamnella rubrinervis]